MVGRPIALALEGLQARLDDEEEGGVLGEDHRRTESRGYGTRRPVFIELRGGRGLYVVSVDKMDLLND